MNGKHSLSGVRVLIGRAAHQASGLSAGLRELNAQVIEIPFIEIHPPRSYARLDAALKHITKYDWLILTSVNGVEALAGRMKQLKISTAGLENLRIAAIGPATRKAVERLGMKVTTVPERYIAESVVESVRGQVEGKRVLLARARVARDVIPRELRKSAAVVDVVEAYETLLPRESKRLLVRVMNDRAKRPHVITFTSSSTVRNFVALLGGLRRMRVDDLNGIRLASIGPVTSATLRDFGLPVHIEAQDYTIPGLIDAIARDFLKSSGATG